MFLFVKLGLLRANKLPKVQPPICSSKKNLSDNIEKDEQKESEIS